MSPEFEIVEDFAISSEVADAMVRVRLRRQTNHKPARYSPGPYWLDLSAGSVHVPHYCVEERFAREAAARFLLEHVRGIVPTRH